MLWEYSIVPFCVIWGGFKNGTTVNCTIYIYLSSDFPWLAWLAWLCKRIYIDTMKNSHSHPHLRFLSYTAYFMITVHGQFGLFEHCWDMAFFKFLGTWEDPKSDNSHSFWTFPKCISFPFQSITTVAVPRERFVNEQYMQLGSPVESDSPSSRI